MSVHLNLCPLVGKQILPLDIVEGPSPVTTNPMISEEAVAKVHDPVYVLRIKHIGYDRHINCTDVTHLNAR